MLYKIEIDWKTRSPFLKVATGEVRVGQIDFGCLDPKEHEAAYIKKEMGSFGVERGNSLLYRCHPLLKTVVQAYYDGMNLESKSFVWFENCHRHNNVVTITMND